MADKEFRILIVEDNGTYRELFKNILERAFPKVLIAEATDGREALYKVDAFLPDLIFMDIHLGEENGITITKKIKTAHPNIHIVIFTFYDIPEYRKAAFQSGADHFFVKSSLNKMEIEELVKSYQAPVGNVMH